MYRQDLIAAEVERLAQVLARIIGLKTDSKFEEATKLLDDTLEHSFGFSSALLYTNDNSAFAAWLKTENLGAEKINSLTDFLFAELDFEKQPDQSLQIAQKLNLLYLHLADVYQVVHLINMGRQQYIQQYL